jgi:hypothetical protein
MRVGKQPAAWRIFGTTFEAAQVQCWCSREPDALGRSSHSVQMDASKSFPKLGIPLIHSYIKKAYVRDYLSPRLVHRIGEKNNVLEFR